jgi:hypothetical protein
MRGRFAPLLLVGALGLVGCGGGDDETAATDPPATAPPTRAPTTEVPTTDGPVTVETQPTQTAAPPTDPPPTITAAPPLPEACELVQQAEAEALAGTPLDPPVESEGMCMRTGPVTGPTAQVEVYVGDGAFKMLEIDRDTLAHPFTEVDGIADEVWQEDNHIFLRKGTTWVAIRLVLLNDPVANEQPMRDLAAIVATRM